MTVLAHQGGWDEIGLVLLPIALFAGMLFVANKRAARMAADEHDRRDATDGEPPA